MSTSFGWPKTPRRCTAGADYQSPVVRNDGDVKKYEIFLMAKKKGGGNFNKFKNLSLRYNCIREQIHHFFILVFFPGGTSLLKKKIELGDNPCYRKGYWTTESRSWIAVSNGVGPKENNAALKRLNNKPPTCIAQFNLVLGKLENNLLDQLSLCCGSWKQGQGFTTGSLTWVKKTKNKDRGKA